MPTKEDFKHFEFTWMRRWRLVMHLIETYKLKKIAEIGVFEGCIAKRVLRETERNNDNIDMNYIDEYVMVDIEERSGITRIKNLPRARFIHKPSLEAAKEFPDGYFDLVFVDANHLYEEVKPDLIAWIPKVRKGGWLLGHDFYLGNTPTMDGPIRAVTEIFGKDFEICHDESPFGNRCIFMKQL